MFPDTLSWMNEKSFKYLIERLSANALIELYWIVKEAKHAIEDGELSEMDYYSAYGAVDLIVDQLRSRGIYKLVPVKEASND